VQPLDDFNQLDADFEDVHTLEEIIILLEYVTQTHGKSFDYQKSAWLLYQILS
jgi:hypothetical protein